MSPSCSRATAIPTIYYRGCTSRTCASSTSRSGRSTARLTAAVATRARRWDAIVAHWLVPSAIAALPSAPPLVAIAHGGDVFTLRRLHLLGPTLHALRRRDAQLVFVSEQLRAIARE